MQRLQVKQGGNHRAVRLTTVRVRMACAGMATDDDDDDDSGKCKRRSRAPVDDAKITARIPFHHEASEDHSLCLSKTKDKADPTLVPVFKNLTNQLDFVAISMIARQCHRLFCTHVGGICAVKVRGF